jgi:hypothetical protein
MLLIDPYTTHLAFTNSLPAAARSSALVDSPSSCSYLFFFSSSFNRAIDSNVLEAVADADEERLATDALALAEIALKCLAYDVNDRATVAAVLPGLERMLSS